MKFIQELFYVVSASLLTFAVFETLWPGLVLSVFNLNYLLIFWLFNGIVLLLLAKK